ncbi:UNVERIFIED_CONTAM: hypothetical protein K2H54_030372 [Gekko kuhli]
MDLEKSSVWESLKQKTKPLLHNLSIRRTRKHSKMMVTRQTHPLDRRLSSSVPDMLNVDVAVREQTGCSRPQALSAFLPSGFAATEMFVQNSSSASLKQDGEDWQWSRRETVHMEIGVRGAEGPAASGLGPEGKRKSSEELFDLLQRSSFSSDLSEDAMGYMSHFRMLWYFMQTELDTYAVA